MLAVLVNWKVIFFDALVFVQDAGQSFLAHFPSKMLGMKVFGEIFGSHDGEVVRSGDGERVSQESGVGKLFLENLNRSANLFCECIGSGFECGKSVADVCFYSKENDLAVSRADDDMVSFHEW